MEDEITPEFYSVDKETLTELLEASRECANYLLSELEDTYPLRHSDFVQGRRYENDAAVASRVLKLCTILDGGQ